MNWVDALIRNKPEPSLYNWRHEPAEPDGTASNDRARRATFGFLLREEEEEEELMQNNSPRNTNRQKIKESDGSEKF